MSASTATLRKRRTLGRGLAALIPDAAESSIGSESPRVALAGEAVVQIPIDEIKASPFQPRRHFDEAALEELTQSVREQGVLQPILLRPVDRGYEIVMGERRFRACCRAGLRTVPAMIRILAEKDRLEIALIENLQREDLNPVEEAEAYQRLIKELGYSQAELSRRVGKDRSSISNSLRLLKLPDEVLDGLIQGAIAMGHGRALLGLASTDAILSLYARVVGEALSVRQTEDAVRKLSSSRRTRSKAKQLSSELIVVQDRLSRYLGTRVKLKTRSRGEGGKIELEFYSAKDLNRLIDRIENQFL